MPRVVHFELTAQNTERAEKFYSQVFGWKLEKWGGSGPMDYWMIHTGGDKEPGINGGLRKREGNEPAHTVNTVDVSSVDEYSAKVSSHGGKVIAPKMAIPRVGYFALCQDTEGNSFGIMQFDEHAK
jgi:predicted enzyme related to lactoylglutathione lyase